MKKLLTVLLFLIPQALWATTRTVSPAGTNTGNCSVLPCRTLAYSLGQMAGGDTLLIGNGTYAEAIANGAIPLGSIGAPTILQAVNANQAIIKPTASIHYGIELIRNSTYITLDGLYVDGASASGFGDREGIDCEPTFPCDHIIVKNGTVTNWLGSAVSGRWDHSQFLNLDVLNNGTALTNQFHGVYLAGSDNVVDGVRVTNQAGGWCVQIYYGSGAADRNIVRNSVLKGCEQGGIIATRDAALIENDIIYSNGVSGVDVFSAAATNTKILNVSFYTNATYGVLLDDEGGTSKPSGTTIQNAIFYGDGSGAINNTGTGTTCSNNLNASGCSPTEGGTDPLYVSPATGNFHIAAGSPAATIGANLCSTFCTDFDGTPRTVPWSAGAFVATVPPSKYQGFFAFF